MGSCDEQSIGVSLFATPWTGLPDPLNHGILQELCQLMFGEGQQALPGWQCDMEKLEGKVEVKANSYHEEEVGAS